MKSDRSGYCSARDKGFTSHLSVAFDSLAAGKTGIREELPRAPSSPGLIPSTLPHLSMPKTGEGRSCVSEGRVPGDRRKVGLWVRTWFSFIFHRRTEFETGVPTAKTWVNPGFVEPGYYKFFGGEASL